MSFASPEFLVLFLPATLAAFWLAMTFSGKQAARLILLVASLVFYGAFRIDFVPIILISILVNYAFGIRIGSTPNLAYVGVAFNLLLLGWFKYAIFFADVLTGQPVVFGLTHIALPLGISFFTFQQIAWLIDIRRERATAASLLEHALFVSFFPQLVAGPIVHHSDLVPQLRRLPGLTALSDPRLTAALLYLFGGLAKKLLFADPLGEIIDPAWAAVDQLNFYDAWICALGFGLQLYFDFSAYGEMAIGLALLFGIKLPINFNSPYKAVSLQDFWRRWHITLGAFLRDYVFIPLGGSRNGPLIAVFAIITTMFLGGLWHGAGYTFVIWGVAHGVVLALEALLRRQGVRLPQRLGQTLTLSFVLLAWVPFRATSLSDAILIYEYMAGLHGVAFPDALAIPFGLPSSGSTFFDGMEILQIVVLFQVVLAMPSLHELVRDLRPSAWHVPGFAAVALFLAFSVGTTANFLYFNF